MKSYQKLVSLLAASALPAFAAPTEITVNDNAPDFNGFLGSTAGSATGVSNGISGVGIALEDNETERTNVDTISSQIWDLEGFFRDDLTKKLYIVSGYDLLNGHSGGRPGDLFIKVGGSSPAGTPTTASGNVANSLYNYDYAIDLSVNSFSGGSAGSYGANAVSFGSALTVYDLKSTTSLHTTINDSLRSNPWKVVGGQASTAFDQVYSTGYSYGASSTVGGVAHGMTGVGTHYVMEIDISFLGTIDDNDTVFFSYTMECGNDSLKGETSGGFRQVPDASMSALLISMGLAAMSFVGFRRRK